MSIRLRPLLAVALLATCAAASAAPYAITYVGYIGYPGVNPIPGIHQDERYQFTLIMDNGGNSARAQTWTRPHLTCAIFRINNAGDVTLTNDLAVASPTNALGTVATDSNGHLSQVFQLLNNVSLPVGSYMAAGVVLTPPVSWFGNTNLVLADSGGPQEFPNRNFSARSDSEIPIDHSRWIAPYPVAGPCDDTPLAGPGTVASVPTLSAWGLCGLVVALGLGMGAIRWHDRQPRTPGDGRDSSRFRSIQRLLNKRHGRV